jgi:hypothetical protein
VCVHIEESSQEENNPIAELSVRVQEIREKRSTDPQTLHKVVEVLRLEFNAQAEKTEDAGG